MKTKHFTCAKCNKNFQLVKNLQPVPTVSFGSICQHCWCSIAWGTMWANECRNKEPKMWPVSKLEPLSRAEVK